VKKKIEGFVQMEPLEHPPTVGYTFFSFLPSSSFYRICFLFLPCGHLGFFEAGGVEHLLPLLGRQVSRDVEEAAVEEANAGAARRGRDPKETVLELRLELDEARFKRHELRAAAEAWKPAPALNQHRGHFGEAVHVEALWKKKRKKSKQNAEKEERKGNKI
jgi:hypothetical protein